MAHYSNEFLLVAKNGNVAAFEQIYSDYKDRVYAIALSTLKNPQDAEDAVQQTFIKVYEKLSSLEDPSAFSTWIQRIAINESRMILRKRKEVLSMDDNENGALVEKLEDDYMLPQEYLERDDLSRRMREIIDELPTAQRQALVLQMYSNLSMAEIAEVMDCSENTVKSRIRYAKATIKTEIEERERKSGEKFYGVIMLPFGSIFSGLVAKQSMSAAVSAQIWSAVSQHIAGIVAATGAAAGTAVGTGLSLGAKIAIGALIGAAVIGGTVFAVTKLTDAFSDKSAQTDPIPAVTEAVTEAATQAPTQKPTQKPTQAPTAAPTEADHAAVYAGYLEALTENESAIRSYNWQKTADGELRPVVFADVYGDDAPEMLFMDVDPSQSYASELSVYTYENGSLKTIQEPDQVDVNAASGTTYYLFTVESQEGFYCYHAIGDESYSTTVDHYAPSNGKLNKSEALYMNNSSDGSVIYHVNGTEASHDDYVLGLDQLLDNADHLLMMSVTGSSGDFVVDETFASLKNEALTYDEAIAYLQGNISSSGADTEPSKETNDTGISQEKMLAKIAGSYQASYVAMGGTDLTTLTISPEGDIDILVRARMNPDETSYHGTAGSLTDKGNGICSLTVVSGDSTLDGDTLTYYPAGTSLSLLTEEETEAINRLDGEDPSGALDTAYVISSGGEAFRLAE
ncbi:MAG: sigma-70 family RNA polymerase sigma factor [Ruminococcus sp.]|nr:sigma-70 family RNA polymerase sigma factor [Ruminococcus sp.]